MRQLFLQEWDVVGVAGLEEASDEYDAYANKAYVMLMDESAEADAIAAYLFRAATGHMGLSATAQLQARCDHVADLPVALRPDFNTH